MLRARFRLSSSARLVWLVTDLLPLDELQHDARRDIADALFDLGVQSAGHEYWRTVRDDGALWLVLSIAVVPYTDPRRDRTRRATTPQEIS
jgi:hypothetical protein